MLIPLARLRATVTAVTLVYRLLSSSVMVGAIVVSLYRAAKPKDKTPCHEFQRLDTTPESTPSSKNIFARRKNR